MTNDGRLGSNYQRLWLASGISALGDGVRETVLPLFAASLATGEKVTIKMKIAAKASSGHKTFKVSATSKAYAGSVDTVKAKAKIT